ncbi:MAG: HAMP domain-containing histidine kinase [Paraprevotella sp.]|nr:HAMP domain-containing histidine kinase [Paraprevotella sp.]
MKRRRLLNRALTQFIICVVILLALATPVFYWLTEHYYAEDMIEVIGAAQSGQPLPAFDLEEYIVQGIMIQFILIIVLLGIAIVFTAHFIARRIWKPFDETLKQIEGFRLEDGKLPVLPDSNVEEFSRLNRTLHTLMANSLKSYRTQKEFTENASHELQTPLAVFQSRLDNLLQLPDLTQPMAETIQGLYQISGRLSRLNRNLLLLAKIDNRQYEKIETVDVAAVVNDLLPFLESLAQGISIRRNLDACPLKVRANRVLLESLLNNLVVNAVRHNRPNGEILLTLKGRQLKVTNTSDGEALNERLMFNRFYRPSERTPGNGLGLSIVKAICDYHGWTVSYDYKEKKHTFTLQF